MPWHEFDKGGKWLIEHHGDSILRLGGVRDVAAWRSVQAEVVQPGQLPDGLLEVQLAGQPRPVTFILELATKAERRLTRQVFRDMMLVCLDRGTLPEVVALILRRQGKYRAPAKAELQSQLGLSRCQLSWRVVELWTLPAEELLAANDVGLIPWVPLADYAGPPEPLLEECCERINRQAPPEERVNLLAVTQVMSRLRFTDPHLLAILGGSQVMNNSPLIQELMVKREVETKHEAILRVLRKRLGAVPRGVASGLRAVRDPARLNDLLDLAAVCADLEAFRERLSS